MRKIQKNDWQVVKGDITRPGVTKMADGINFSFEAANREDLALLLYKKGTAIPAKEVSFKDAAVMGNVLAIKILNLDETNYEYNYRIKDQIIQDPYAKIIIGRESFGEIPQMIRCGFDTAKYDWQDDKPLHIPYHNCSLYSLHVRGFTKHPNSKVKHKGTFLGISEKAQYLKDLGFNQIKLMPAYEFNEITDSGYGLESRYIDLTKERAKINYWGYGPGNYFAPKYSYADSDRPEREFRDMVRTLHQKGIEVIMEIYFSADTQYRMAAECLRHWRQNYHVDGFHLVGNQKLADNLAKDTWFADTKIISEYFDQDDIYLEGALSKAKNLGEYNDGFKFDIRCFLKGDADRLNNFAFRSRRNPAHCSVINYITDHNGFNLMDLFSYDEKHNEANLEGNQDGPVRNESWNCGEEGPSRKKKILDLRVRQIKNALTILFFSAGTPMIMAGDECGNTQNGNNNPYCQDNETTWVDWKETKRSKEIREYVRQLTAFRARHDILHMEKELRIMDTRSCGYPDLSYHGERAWYGEFENGNRHLGIMYCGKYAGEDCFIYAAFNMHWIEHEFALPHLTEGMNWYTAIDTGNGIYEPGEEKLLSEQQMFSVPGRTIIVLIGRKQETPC